MAAGLLNFNITDDFLGWVGSVALQGSPRATLECVRAFSGNDFRPDMRPSLCRHW